MKQQDIWGMLLPHMDWFYTRWFHRALENKERSCRQTYWHVAPGCFGHLAVLHGLSTQFTVLQGSEICKLYNEPYSEKTQLFPHAKMKAWTRCTITIQLKMISVFYFTDTILLFPISLSVITFHFIGSRKIILQKGFITWMNLIFYYDFAL